MNPLIERTIDRQEAKLGAPLDYLRSLADVSTGLFLKFGLTTLAATHRQHAPCEAWHLARLGATRVQDCGTCLQIVVNAARSEGVAADLLRIALDADTGHLGEPERLALQFGEAVAAQSPDSERLRTALVATLGEEAVVELALAVAMVQVYPILKRGLGQATACSLVSVCVG